MVADERNQKMNRLYAHLDAEDWGKARRILVSLLRKEPDSHWLLTTLGLTYYEQRNYKKALALSDRALTCSPDCPLVLYYRAGALDMLGKKQEAIEIFRKLIANGSRRKTFGACWESPQWTESLVNDCRYRIGLCYRDLGRKGLAKRYLKSHLKHRRPGLPSTYSRREVEGKLAKL